MSLRRVDPRFCLPEPPRSVIVMGGLDDWAEGLERCGVEVRSAGPADLVVAPAGRVAEALAAGAATVALEGRGGARLLRDAGLSVRSFLVRPKVEAPEVLLPRDDAESTAYAIRTWSAGYTRAKQARNRVAAVLALRGRLPEVEPVIAFGRPAPWRPSWVAAEAEPLGVASDAGWFMSCGQGDALSRNVLHLFRPGEPEPAWALKFARLPGYDEPFRRDEAGLTLAHEAGGIVSRHAPRLVGRFAAGGLEASLETAAVGEKLRATLLAPGGTRRKLRLVREVAAWILAVGRDTVATAGSLGPELERLRRDVVPAWADAGVGQGIVDQLPPLPSVLQHNDLGCWNVVTGRAGFTAVDWESACGSGLPLWDLVYFLTDALATLDGASSPDEQDEHSRRLLLGELPRSQELFAWVGRMAQELDIPRGAVGPVVTLGWLHHGLSPRRRTASVGRLEAGMPGLPAPGSRLAGMWLAEPGLGVEWRAWHGA